MLKCRMQNNIYIIQKSTVKLLDNGNEKYNIVHREPMRVMSVWAIMRRKGRECKRCVSEVVVLGLVGSKRKYMERKWV